VCNNDSMLQSKILDELAKNQKNFRIGEEVFNVALPNSEVKKGKSVQEIVAVMEKASHENLFRIKASASLSE